MIENFNSPKNNDDLRSNEYVKAKSDHIVGQMARPHPVSTVTKKREKYQNLLVISIYLSIYIYICIYIYIHTYIHMKYNDKGIKLMYV